MRIAFIFERLLCERSSGLSENPLLPHNKLRELHTLMVRCRALARKHRSRGPAREALLAATHIHLLPGDLLSASAKDAVATELAPEAKKPSTSGLLMSDVKLAGRLALCAAAARGMQAAGTEGMVLAFATAGHAETEWKTALEWSQNAQLPLILACTDATGGVRSRSAKSPDSVIDFDTFSRFAKRVKLPVLTVDGEDAVAVYRVMQECALRARMGGGPAVVWAVLTPNTAQTPKLKKSATPIVRLESYMCAREITYGD